MFGIGIFVNHAIVTSHNINFSIYKYDSHILFMNVWKIFLYAFLFCWWSKIKHCVKQEIIAKNRDNSVITGVVKGVL